MARIHQIGPGRKTKGIIDGITYITRNGKTYVRSAPIMPTKAYTTPAALRRQAFFKMIQTHMRYHLRTIKQTFTPKGNGTPSNQYYSVNNKALTNALAALADRLVNGEDVTLNEIESAISTYAASHPQAIKIAKMSGYQDVFLSGAWPATITLNALAGDNTVIIIVAENGTTTTINPDGTTTVVAGFHTDDEDASASDNPGTSGSGSGSSTSTSSSNVAAPTFSGESTFAESTEVSMSAEAGAEIHYTTDGSVPNASSQLYSTPITLTESTTLKAIAIKDGESSAVTTRTFTKGSTDGNGTDLD